MYGEVIFFFDFSYDKLHINTPINEREFRDNTILLIKTEIALLHNRFYTSVSRLYFKP
jgi:hypothetical protein